jgi:hypothetical protein
MSAFWRKADMRKNAIDVAIGGKADMPYCGDECLLLTQSRHRVAGPTEQLTRVRSNLSPV